jgi:hypothetical protein
LVIFLVFCVVLCCIFVLCPMCPVSVSGLSILDCPFGFLSCLVNRIE